ncbi:DUF4190 domain-containing protein [Nocardia miyunensis]|uniref:DUF4190 domain-containing protein n=1 Tax=Nocardia miyunensis TaxID=282684 RepID=UPI000832E297|nr:DUF4190 domain-containing protein [Nocardia miyunensis]
MTEYPPPGQYPSASSGSDPARYPGGGYPPPPPSDYPAPPGEPYRPQGQGRGLAITSLVLGILALLSCPTVLGGVLFGLLGLIFGIIAVVKARRGTAGGGVMAWFGLSLATLGLVAGIAIGVVEGLWVADHGGRTYMDCTKQANGDKAKLQQCADQFRSSLQNTPTRAR